MSWASLTNEERAAWEADWECHHPESELRAATKANGVKVFYRQCLHCGNYAHANVRVGSLTKAEREAAPEIDRDLRKQWWDNQWSDYTARRNEKAAAETAEFWAWYDDYLNSGAWKERRRLVMARADGQCEGCGLTRATQVHHLTYQRVGDEMLFDLVAVCDACHESLHKENANG